MANNQQEVITVVGVNLAKEISCCSVPGRCGVMAKVTLSCSPERNFISVDVACPQAQPVGGHGAMQCRLNGKGCKFSFDYPHVRNTRGDWQPPEEIVPLLEALKKNFGIA
ncbi:MAG: hypothetical protein WCT16_03630 [Candidatus Buchananbacteria bacterium]